jgi:CRISPR-associated protein Cmr6
MNDSIIIRNKFFNKTFLENIKKLYEYKFFIDVKGQKKEFIEIPKNQFKETNFFYLYNNFPVIEVNYKVMLNESIINYQWEKDFLTNINKTKQKMMESLKESGYLIEQFDLKLQWRLIVGLGASHPQETSMTLHHIFGIPYIPGSALKGSSRHYMIWKFVDENEEELKSLLGKSNFAELLKELNKALEKEENLTVSVGNISFKDLIHIFGTQNRQGKIIFFDAYPIEEIKLKIDIMNPHYPDYYTKDKPPTDWQNPIPIKFLTVENTKFRFYLAAKDKDQNLLNHARKILNDALLNYGVGAKTSLGYGLFEESK